MSMSTTTRVMTAEGLWQQCPRERCELVKGELRMMSPAGSRHGWVIMNVAIPLGTFIKQHNLGYIFGAETGFVIERDPDTVRAPDVAFVRVERVSGELSQKFFDGAPDLVVEVLSPDDTVSQVQEKTENWLRTGCQEVWLIDPESRSATKCVLSQVRMTSTSEQQFQSDLFPGFTLPLSEVFE